MPKGTCASCLDFDVDKLVKSNDKIKPTWLQKTDFVREFIHSQSLKLRSPSNHDVIMKLNLHPSHAGKKILYWATTEKSEKSPLIVDARKAYHNFENSGVASVTSNGDVTVKIACPQLYSVKIENNDNNMIFFRHLHFVVQENNSWGQQIYTKIVICKYTLKQFLQHKDDELTVLINALPSDYYAKDHIPNSFNLFHKDVAKMTTEKLEEWFHDVVKIHYPKLYTYVKKKQLGIYELPIIVYCAHDKCNAAELTITELMKKGFVNINEYDGGMKEYRKKFPQEK